MSLFCPERTSARARRCKLPPAIQKTQLLPPARCGRGARSIAWSALHRGCAPREAEFAADSLITQLVVEGEDLDVVGFVIGDQGRGAAHGG